ncbi:MAG TPA: nicotinate-nucleotide adenylyltransferase [Pirellulales bacterium]|jgi:nicotinate-nucleotide adenylyltransferase|nr:nicotinate-nucleotide adenylyltransferase [Pirellulales bacterium]
MRIGLFGGSFDPVHYGHLLLAECCREQVALNQVWFIPAANPPHKRGSELTDGMKRVDMLRLATGGQPAFVVSTMELDRGGISYTVDTLEALHAQLPASELFLLLGSDSLAELATWRDPARICALALPVAVRRAGGPPPDFSPLATLISADRLEAIRRLAVEMPLVELSASAIRRRTAAGLSIRYRTPRAVEQYIAAGRLYASTEESR